MVNVFNNFPIITVSHITKAHDELKLFTFLSYRYDHVEKGEEDYFNPQDAISPDNTGDWFEFVWSTTRAIRKDITQQDLNRDPLAVDLIEKCARFHIMCSERLIEEESHNFDKKLNDENLTKCVQTLKHMYYGKNSSSQYFQY